MVAGSWCAVWGTKLSREARSRLVVIEFPSADAASDCYNSPEYTAAKAIRHELSIQDFVVAPGYDGPQPADSGSS
ncbi:MAG: DUF1330 domain-containing protein [Devosia sp.]